MYFDKDGKLTPMVLSSSTPSADFMTWTLSVNPEAVFSDGSKITAEDVVGTWNLCARPATKNARVDLFLGGVAGYGDVSLGKALDMTGLAVTDDETVTVTLSEPDPIFNQKIATDLIPPVKISQAVDENGNEKPDWWKPENGVVVSGPFMPESMDLDQGVVVMVPNPNFFGPAPKLEKIVITTVSDPSTATLMLKARHDGRCHRTDNADHHPGPRPRIPRWSAARQGPAVLVQRQPRPDGRHQCPQGPGHVDQSPGSRARRVPRRSVYARRPDPEQGAGRRSRLPELSL